jgi:hypothetical protein
MPKAVAKQKWNRMNITKLAPALGGGLAAAAIAVGLATSASADDRSYQAGYDAGYDLAPSWVYSKGSRDQVRDRVCEEARTILRLSSDGATYDEGDYMDGCADGVKDALK